VLLRAHKLSAALGRRWQHWQSIWRLALEAGSARVVTALVINVVLGLLPLCFIVLIADVLARVPMIVSQFAADQHWQQATAAVVLAVGAFAVEQVATPFRFAVAEGIARQVDDHCAARLMSAALSRVPLRSLVRQDSQDLLENTRGGFERYSFSPGDAVAATLLLVYRYVNLAGAVVLIGVVLGAGPAVLVGLTALAIRFGQRGSLGRFGALWDRLAANRRRLHYLADLSSGHRIAKEVRVLGLLDWLVRRLGTETEGFLRPLWIGRRKLLLWPFVLLGVAGLLGATAAFLVLAQTISRGGTSLFELAIVLQSVLVPLRFGVYFPESDTKTQYGMGAFKSLRQFEKLATDPVADSGSTAELPGTIRFEDVVFRYDDGERTVLDRLDLEIEAGRSTAIVGLNGSGKTTLVKVLTRLHDPESGRVTAGGVDLLDVHPQAWRRRCAVVFQDFARYELSLHANIRMGAPHVTEPGAVRAAVERAIDRAGLRALVTELPLGGETVLSRQYNDGHELSGGQWQRVALARAFYAVEHGARVLVMDEPTAQLDVRAEARFFDEFLELTRGLTSVVISHRFSAVRHADQIVVLEEGRVLERGSHDELVAAGGRYAELFLLQASQFEDTLDGIAAGGA
jgi:ATP-binding cassette subfamily B protein